jgi:hypothetical protein
VACAVDGTTDTIDDVRSAFADDVDIFEVPNNAGLREVASFIPLFERVRTSDSSHATLWAHAKGIRHAWSESRQTTTMRWSEMLYESLLDYWPLTNHLLNGFPIVGSFKKTGAAFPGTDSSWHYSGSFFWFRNAELFKRDWTRIIQHKWGIESYPSLHFANKEAGCVFWEKPNNEMDMYKPEYCQKVLLEFEKWKLSNQRYYAVAK